MLASVTSLESALLEIGRDPHLRKFQALSIRGGSTPTVVLGRHVALYLGPDWTPELAARFAQERSLPPPLDVPVEAGFLELLPIVTVT